MQIIDFIKKKGKSVYIAKMRITDNDIEMLEDLAYCITGIDKPENRNSRISKWLRRNFQEFQRFWKKYDNPKED